MVTGTTGVDAALASSDWPPPAQRIALLRAANFSLGVAVLTRLLREAAAALPDWDLEIVEAHHGRKQDAPSGTALALGAGRRRRARNHAGRELPSTAREGRTGRANDGSIGFAVVRGGDIVGEHIALLIGQGERWSWRIAPPIARSLRAVRWRRRTGWLGAPPGPRQLDAMLSARAAR